MKKYLLLGSIILLLITGCSNITPKVELTPTEITKLNGDSNKGAELLIRKAILNDMTKYNYTLEEKEALKENKENLEIEFYLNRLATKRAKVTDEQVINIYEANKVQLKNISPEIALPQIKEQLLLQQVNFEKINYINSLIEKYNLNDIFKSYSNTLKVEEKTEIKNNKK